MLIDKNLCRRIIWIRSQSLVQSGPLFYRLSPLSTIGFATESENSSVGWEPWDSSSNCILLMRCFLIQILNSTIKVTVLKYTTTEHIQIFPWLFCTTTVPDSSKLNKPSRLKFANRDRIASAYCKPVPSADHIFSSIARQSSSIFLKPV